MSDETALNVREAMPAPPHVNPRLRLPTVAEPSVETVFEGLRAADRSMLARAITWIESEHPAQRAKGEALLQRVLPVSGGSQRVGITGVPGVGKSTFLESLGLRLIEQGHRVAVLAVDPSSARTGGSILGDKSRMPGLAASPGAFVRPSPGKGNVGGVALRTREAILLLEAADYDVVFVETIGVGQSETTVAQMVDTFVLLMLPGAGDELQGIKRGIMEMADLLVIHKADGPLEAAAEVAAVSYRAALHLFPPSGTGWSPPVVRCSSVTGFGIDHVWEQIQAHRIAMEVGGHRLARRLEQWRVWYAAEFEAMIRSQYRLDAQSWEAAIAEQRLPGPEIRRWLDQQKSPPTS